MNLPNKITMSRIFIVPVFMIFILPLPESLLGAIPWEGLVLKLRDFNSFLAGFGHYVAAVIFILAASTDGIDGYIARKRKQVTKFGIFLDPVADKLLITAALIALVQRGNITGWAAIIIICRELMVMGLRLVAAGEGHVIAASKLAKIKTITQIVAISAALLDNFPLSLITSFKFDSLAINIAVLITIYSGYDYLVKNSNLIVE